MITEMGAVSRSERPRIGTLARRLPPALDQLCCEIVHPAGMAGYVLHLLSIHSGAGCMSRPNSPWMATALPGAHQGDAPWVAEPGQHQQPGVRVRRSGSGGLLQIATDYDYVVR